MKRLIVAAILAVTATATVCQAEDGWDRTGSTESTNLSYEVKRVSVERLNPSTVRALTRFVRLDPARADWKFGGPNEAYEVVTDFDCDGTRAKDISGIVKRKDGSVFRADKDWGTPTYYSIPQDSPLKFTVAYVCTVAK